jgi:DNA-binding HxlR family transcriptional regulator
MLSVTLRALERDGLVMPIIAPMNPQRVNYALTEFGRTLIEPLAALADWARTNRSTVEEARRKFDAMPRRRQHGGSHAISAIGTPSDVVR